MRKLSEIETECFRTPDQLKRDELFCDFLLESNYINLEHNQQVKSLSPFRKLYDDKIKQYGYLLNNTNSESNKNVYYNKELFAILQDQFYLLPLWSGIMIHNSNIYSNTKTRLSNNPVENWFSQLKNNILYGRRVSISELSSLVYSRNLAKYKLFYEMFHTKKIKEQKEYEEN